jgi:hypothetical protein
MKKTSSEMPGVLTPVKTKFHAEATKPGGVTRSHATARANQSLIVMKPVLVPRVEHAMKQVLIHSTAVAAQEKVEASTVAELHKAVAEVRDLGAIVDQSLLSSVAAMLCDILEIVEDETIEYPKVSITVFIDTMVLAASEDYRGKSEEDVPELMAGLARIDAWVSACASE